MTWNVNEKFLDNQWNKNFTVYCLSAEIEFGQSTAELDI